VGEVATGILGDGADEMYVTDGKGGIVNGVGDDNVSGVVGEVATGILGDGADEMYV
mgnify:CR=1